MAKIILNTSDLEAGFFDHKELYAIGSPAKEHRLCWEINREFGLAFYRQPELDVQVVVRQRKTGSMNSLFEQSESNELLVNYFSVYQHDLPDNSSDPVYLYNNHCGNYRLIPELKTVDYFLLVPQPPKTDPEWAERFLKLSHILWMRRLVIPNLKSKNLLLL